MEKRLDVADTGSNPVHLSKSNNMKIKEKIAMTWTLPIAIVAMIIISLFTLIAYLITAFLDLTGTLGAAIIIINKVRIYLLKKQIKKDGSTIEDLRKFDSLIHKTQ